MNRLVPLALLLLPLVARGHGGEDHGAPPASGATEVAGARTAFGQTEAFELLFKFAPPEPGKPLSIRVFLADYATNAPVDQAKIALELQGAAPLAAAAEPAGAPGTYHVVLDAPPLEKLAVIATVQAGDTIDLVEIKELDLTPAPPPASKPGSETPWLALAAGAAGVLVVIVVAFALARRRARAASAATFILAVALSPALGWAHAGEEHDEAKPAAAAAGEGIRIPKEAQFLLGVRTAVLAERELRARIDTVGRIVPRVDGNAVVAAPIAGRIMPPPSGRLPFLGDRVKKGQPLLVVAQSLGAVETGQLRSQEIAARNAVAQARAKRDQAARELERRRSLAGVVSQKDIQQAQLDSDLAQKDVDVAQGQAALYGGKLQDIVVTAPIDGTIAQADVSVGGQVTADQKLYVVVEGSTLWVEANVFEADVGRIEKDAAASVRVQGYDRAFAAALYRLGGVVDPATRTLKAVFAVPNPDGALRPGMFAEVAIVTGAPSKALAVPDTAVVEEGGRRFVFVHTAPESFVRREVVLGSRDGDAWAVRAGLAADERVVVQGTYQLRTAR